MRISDWSSDVCSSDLRVDAGHFDRCHAPLPRFGETLGVRDEDDLAAARHHLLHVADRLFEQRAAGGEDDHRHRLVDQRDRAVLHFTRRIAFRSEEHTSELQSLMRISYAVFRLKKKTNTTKLNQKQY